MIKLNPDGAWLIYGEQLIDGKRQAVPAAGAAISGAELPSRDEARENTITYRILRAHDVHGGKGDKMHIRFDAMVSHDITYVGIIQTARASGLDTFPLPYAMTNCHNSLCAVGGTINEDDHVFGLSAAKKYGGIYVPANQAVIHQYAREALSACGNMILGSDSHTRYGSLGNMGVGEGGGELVKQLLRNTWDIDAPKVVLVWLEGKPRHGVGPHDVAISLVKAVFESGFVKNKVLEFAGPGVKELPVDFRNGIDVMTTETTCLSSIWITDEKVQEYFQMHGRPEAYKELRPGDIAWYDSVITIDLSEQESMIALPYHPSNAVSIHELQADPETVLRKVEEDTLQRFGGKVQADLLSKIKDGKVHADQAIIAGCSGGTYDNLSEAAAILRGKSIGDGYFTMSAYPQSTPVYLAATRSNIAQELLQAGVVIKPAFCGPCFGAGDVPSNNGLSIRHTTRNFPNREGSKPGAGQISMVALMDARSIAATAACGGVITAATDIAYTDDHRPYEFDGRIYRSRIYNGYGAPLPETELRYGPNIKDWPEMFPLEENLLMKLAAVIHDPVTTTDELIPSGETSSYRSNPLKLSEFALSRRVPEYVARAKAILARDLARREGHVDGELADALRTAGASASDTALVSCIFANKPGDGSAREQAASCQKVLGGGANICYEYATKRYRSNCINWGLLPFTISAETAFDWSDGDYVYVPGVRAAVLSGAERLEATVISGDRKTPISLYLHNLTSQERQIIADGCLMNYYKNRK